MPVHARSDCRAPARFIGVRNQKNWSPGERQATSPEIATIRAIIGPGRYILVQCYARQFDDSNGNEFVCATGASWIAFPAWASPA